MISQNAYSIIQNRKPVTLAKTADSTMLEDLSILIISILLTIIVGLVLIINAALTA